MKRITYLKADFPTGFDSELLRIELGSTYLLETAPNDYVKVCIEDATDENAIRNICLAHFAKTPQQRIDDLSDAQAINAVNNGDKNRRFIVEVLYRIDQRLRVLESAPPISKQTFINGIKNIYKNA